MKFASKNIDHTRGLHAIAAFEAFKGLVVMAAGLGLFQFMNGNLQGLADTGLSILSHLHLNPAHHYPQIFLTSLENVTDQNIFWIAMGALAYSVVRLVEAYGLWKNRVWAEWLAIVSAGLYLPLEIYELLKAFSYVKFTITFFNLLLVIYLIFIRFWKRSPASERI